MSARRFLKSSVLAIFPHKIVAMEIFTESSATRIFHWEVKRIRQSNFSYREIETRDNIFTTTNSPDNPDDPLRESGNDQCLRIQPILRNFQTQRRDSQGDGANASRRSRMSTPVHLPMSDLANSGYPWSFTISSALANRNAPKQVHRFPSSTTSKKSKLCESP